MKAGKYPKNVSTDTPEIIKTSYVRQIISIPNFSYDEDEKYYNKNMLWKGVV